MKSFLLVALMVVVVWGLMWLGGVPLPWANIDHTEDVEAMLTPVIVDWSEAVPTYHAWTPDIEPSPPIVPNNDPQANRNLPLRFPLLNC